MFNNDLLTAASIVDEEDPLISDPFSNIDESIDDAVTDDVVTDAFIDEGIAVKDSSDIIN